MHTSLSEGSSLQRKTALCDMMKTATFYTLTSKVSKSIVTGSLDV